MRRLLMVLAGVIVLSSAAFAVPDLQLYIPGATYDGTSDSWVTPNQSFELWVVASNLDKQPIYNIHLTAALAAGTTPVDGGLSITPVGGSTTTFDAADFTLGTPPPTGLGSLPPHGIFPTNYVDMLVTAETPSNSADWVDTYDYPSPGDAKPGYIYRFNVVTTYNFVHFDAYGYQVDKRDQSNFMFAPFSHDATSGGKPPVPEPATMLLFGLGAAGMGVVRKFRK